MTSTSKAALTLKAAPVSTLLYAKRSRKARNLDFVQGYFMFRQFLLPA
jgi:hypothetical protein